MAYDVKNSKNIINNKFHVITNTIKRIISYFVKQNHLHIDFKIVVKPIPYISNIYVRDADLTIATAWPTAYSVNSLSEKKGKKIYFVQDYEVWNNELFGKRSYELPMQKIVISEWINKKIKEQINCKDLPIVYDGIDQVFLECPFIERYFTKNLKLVMLYHNLKKKGVQNGIESFQRLKREYPSIELTMFGLVDNPKLCDGIIYVYNPSRTELLNLYRESDVMIFPSLEEGWGLTPLEAMATGCVVVGTDVGCMIDIGKDKYNALISRPGDVEAMVDNIKYILSNPEEAKRISKNGYYTVQEFSWDKCSERFEQQLRKVLHESKG